MAPHYDLASHIRITITLFLIFSPPYTPLISAAPLYSCLIFVPHYSPILHIWDTITLFLINEASKSFHLLSGAPLHSYPSYMALHYMLFFISMTPLRYFSYLRHQNPSFSYLGSIKLLFLTYMGHHYVISYISATITLLFLISGRHYTPLSHYLGCCSSYLGRHLLCLHIKLASSASQDSSGPCFVDRSRLGLLHQASSLTSSGNKTSLLGFTSWAVSAKICLGFYTRLRSKTAPSLTTKTRQPALRRRSTPNPSSFLDDKNAALGA